MSTRPALDAPCTRVAEIDADLAEQRVRDAARALRDFYAREIADVLAAGNTPDGWLIGKYAEYRTKSGVQR